MSVSKKKKKMKTIKFIKEIDGRYSAIDVKLGIAGYGNTKKEAKEMLDELIQLYLNTKKDLNERK